MIVKLQMASMPRFPRTSSRSWPIGSARPVLSSAGTEGMAKDAAMKRIHPMMLMAATETRIAMGAARAAPDVSSEMCAAESSMEIESELRSLIKGIYGARTPCERPHGCHEGEDECPSV